MRSAQQERDFGMGLGFERGPRFLRRGCSGKAVGRKMGEQGGG